MRKRGDFCRNEREKQKKCVGAKEEGEEVVGVEGKAPSFLSHQTEGDRKRTKEKEKMNVSFLSLFLHCAVECPRFNLLLAAAEPPPAHKRTAGMVCLQNILELVFPLFFFLLSCAFNFPGSFPPLFPPPSLLPQEAPLPAFR